MECTLLYICASNALAENLKSVQSNLNLGYDFSTLKTMMKLPKKHLLTIFEPEL